MRHRRRKKLISLLYLLKMGWSREEIAEAHGVSLRTIYNWEKEAKTLFGETSTRRLICWACQNGLFPEDEEEKQEAKEESDFAPVDLIGELWQPDDDWPAEA